MILFDGIDKKREITNEIQERYHHRILPAAPYPVPGEDAGEIQQSGPVSGAGAEHPGPDHGTVDRHARNLR